MHDLGGHNASLEGAELFCSIALIKTPLSISGSDTFKRGSAHYGTLSLPQISSVTTST